MFALLFTAGSAQAKFEYGGLINTWCEQEGRPPPISGGYPVECEACHMPGTFNKSNIIQPEWNKTKQSKRAGDWGWFCNAPPVFEPIGDRTVDEGSVLAFLVWATDADVDPQGAGNIQSLRLSAGDLPPGSTFTDNGDGSANFSWIAEPGQAGSYPVTFTVVDDAREVGIDSQQMAITVGAGNHPPTLVEIGNRTASEGQELAFSISATDPDGDSLALVAADLPTGANFTVTGNGSASFSWMPGFDQDGNYPMAVTVTDDGDPAASDSETFTITVGNVNRPPTLATVGNRSADEGVELVFPLGATDPDGDDISFTSGDLPTGGDLTDNGNGTAEFRWTPGFDQAGNYAVTFTVSDYGDPMASDYEQIAITVGSVNRPPQLGAIGNRTVQAGDTLSVVLTASDPDGDGLGFSVSDSPEGSAFTDQGSGMAEFVWTPGADQVGNHALTFRVTDNYQPVESDFEEITITVMEDIVNRPPMLDPIGSQMVSAGEFLMVPMTASDPDGDTLQFAASGLPTGAEFIDAGQGAVELTWTPGFDQVGNHAVGIYVTDDGTPQEGDSEEFTITVGAVNRPPALDPIGSRTTDAEQPLKVVFTAKDSDGDNLRCDLEPVPQGAAFTDNGDGTAELNWTSGVGQVGDYSMTVTVYDDGVPEEMDSETFTVKVEMVDEEPPVPPAPEDGFPDLRVKDVDWNCKKGELRVKGNHAPSRATITIVDAGSGAELGTTTADRRGRFRYRAKAGGDSSSIKVGVISGGETWLTGPYEVDNAGEVCRRGRRHGDDDRRRRYRGDDDRRSWYRGDDDRRSWYRGDDDRRSWYRGDDDRRSWYRGDDDRRSWYRGDDD
ncbi:MAG: Ig-like domain-containing protein [Acidimicrobiales bacterium]|nr:Ig-like domain-containing protein [Acidimicrobiales bacterium]